MTRNVVLGNGSLLVNLDSWLQVRDLYFPYVGQENHVLGNAHRIGLFYDGKISWLNEDGWKRSAKYRQDSLVSNSIAEKDVRVVLNECVHFRHDVFLRKITIKSNRDLSIKMFFHHDFNLYGDGIGDTAAFFPRINAVIHYKRKRYFLVNVSKGKSDIEDYSVGEQNTLSDADDGVLGKNAISQGTVDSIISTSLDLKKGRSRTFYYWICCGRDMSEVTDLNELVLDKGPKVLIDETDKHWRSWVRTRVDFQDLPKKIVDAFNRSLLVIKTQIDKNGAIIAANDSDNTLFNKDTYSYVWPRDGALIATAFIKAGKMDLVRDFFSFCHDIITEQGFMLHKYNPDKSLGSSWHPWIEDGRPVLPIQEDSTALVVRALWRYYEASKDKKFVKKYYESLVKGPAEFMSSYVYSDLKLPRESYDLWEERRGIFTFTSSAVYAGLKCAAQLAKLMNDKSWKRYDQRAEMIREGILTHLYDAKHGFLRGIQITSKGIEKDYTLDSSMYGLVEFGVLDFSDSRLAATMMKLKERLSVRTKVGGFARYENDYYHRQSTSVPGNPWVICTVWMSRCRIDTAETPEELKQVFDSMLWCVDNALPSGVMPEQVHPFTGEALSVSPLTWSHAEFIQLVLEYLKRKKEIGKRKTRRKR